MESIGALDPPARQVGKAVRALVPPGPVKAALSGAWMGHALHPILTDVVIGSFVSASLLDLLGADDDAAQRLLAVGIAAYPATALTGVTDWADSERSGDGIRRVGLVHAVTNATALGLYTASLLARRRGDRGKGKLLALAGAGALGAAGFLGGHMSYAQGVGVDPSATNTPTPAR